MPAKFGSLTVRAVSGKGRSSGSGNGAEPSVSSGNLTVDGPIEAGKVDISVAGTSARGVLASGIVAESIRLSVGEKGGKGALGSKEKGEREHSDQAGSFFPEDEGHSAQDVAHEHRSLMSRTGIVVRHEAEKLGSDVCQRSEEQVRRLYLYL